MKETIVDHRNLKPVYVFLETSLKVAIDRKQLSNEYNHFYNVPINEIEKRIVGYNTFFEKSRSKVIRINTDNLTENEVYKQFIRITI